VLATYDRFEAASHHPEEHMSAEATPKKSRIRVAGICLVALGIIGCTSTSPDAPLLPFLPGPTPSVFTGTVADSITGNGVVTISVTNTSGVTSGTWNMSFGQKNEPQYIISGSVNGTQYSATMNTCIATGTSLSCSTPCSFSFSGTFAASGLTGTYASTNSDGLQSCPARTGTINTTKQ